MTLQNKIILSNTVLHSKQSFAFEASRAERSDLLEHGETEEQRTHALNANRYNLLQSEDYLSAMARINHQRISHNIITIDGKEAGIYNILETGILGNVLHGVILDRGPLWFENYGTLEHFAQFVQDFAYKYPKRLGRKLRFIPEFEDTPQARQVMIDNGFKPVGGEGYETVWLNLRPDTEILRKKLNPKWRNKLNQSEKKSLELVWSDKGTNSIFFKWLIAQYLRDKAQRKYEGPSFKTVKALGDSFSRGKNMLVGCALLDKQPIAGILIFVHGASATYQIGYTSDEGRDNRAHYALLWDALGRLKERGVHDFDLGGVNSYGAQGVKTFKQGMGGSIEKTLGMYCW